jgi:hypothetical protein
VKKKEATGNWKQRGGEDRKGEKRSEKIERGEKEYPIIHDRLHQVSG